MTQTDKVILDCNKDNIRALQTLILLTLAAFYQKCGCVGSPAAMMMHRYVHKEYEMVQYAEQSKNVATS